MESFLKPKGAPLAGPRRRRNGLGHGGDAVVEIEEITGAGAHRLFDRCIDADRSQIVADIALEQCLAVVFDKFGQRRRADLAIERLARSGDAGPVFKRDLVIDRRRRLFRNQPSEDRLKPSCLPVHHLRELVQLIPIGIQVVRGMRSDRIPQKNQEHFEPYAWRIECFLDLVQPVADGQVEVVELPRPERLDAVDGLENFLLCRRSACALELGLDQDQAVACAVEMQGVDSTVVAAIRDGSRRRRIVNLATTYQRVGSQCARKSVKIMLIFSPALTPCLNNLRNVGEEAASQCGFDLGDFLVPRRHGVSSVSSAA